MNATRERALSAVQSREVVIVICAGVLILLFTVAGILTRIFHEKEAALAADWFARGNSSLASGNAREALDDYRSALIFDPPNEDYQLHLAQALAAIGKAGEGRAYLLNLLANRPGDGEINLELARLSAQSDDVPNAVRFYHGAIYGAWDRDPFAQQIRARFELSQLLVRHHEYSLAEAELISLAANVPERDAGMHARVGDLFQSAGDLNRALNEYREALKSDPGNLTALIGAGLVSFKLGNYEAAVADLEKAHQADLENSSVNGALETSRLALSSNPFAEGLRAQERARRVAAALTQASRRADQCSAAMKNQPAADLADLSARTKIAQKAAWSEANLRAQSGEAIAAIETVGKLEDAAARICGEPSGIDAALQLIAHKYRAGREGPPQ